jgi:hypothetical protein
MQRGYWNRAGGALGLLWTLGCAGASDEGVGKRVSQENSEEAPASRDEPRASDEPETTDVPSEDDSVTEDDDAPDLPADDDAPDLASDDDEIEIPADDDAPDTPVDRPSDVPEVSCDVDPTPCGGDVAGTWQVADCPLELAGRVDLSGFGLGCLDAEIHSGALRVSGAWIADTSGNLTDSTTTEGEQQFELRPECLNVSGTLVTCDRLGPPIASSLGYSTVECIDESGGCLCRGTFEQQGSLGIISASAIVRGSYAVDGNTLTTSAVEVSAYEHCVEDEQLVLSIPEPSKVGTVVGSIVLEKRPQ